MATTKAILDSALAGGYGVAAFNVLDDLSSRAVITAAESSSSPVIIQTSVKTVRSVGFRSVGTMVREAGNGASVPVALHLDHCTDRNVISECLAAGWSSVLFDASALTLDAAREQTREVVTEAHRFGAHVESEIENIRGVEDGVGAEDEGRRYPPKVIEEFVEDTGPDFFAPAVGTAHGLYKERPSLDPGRVSVLHESLGIPLVLHGGSGLTDAQFGDLVKRGCAKVNISTALKHSYMKSSLEYLRQCEDRDQWDPPALFRHVQDGVAATVTEHIRMLGSAGQV